MSQRVLITGATGGIGYACAHWFANKGWQLLVTGRNEEKLIALCEEINTNYQVKCIYHLADLSDSSTIKPLFKKINSEFKGLDNVVHCAGTIIEGSLAVIKASDIDQQFNLHLKSSILIAQLASRLMLRKQCGSMVFISSVVANQGAIGQALYSAAKSGLHGMVKSLAKELGPHNIRVNAVAPGFIETDLVREYTIEQRIQLAQSTSLKRLGSAEDVAKAIGFLASDQSSYITGQILAVDAGLTLR